MTGGQLTIASQPSKGTVVTLVVPFENNLAHASASPTEPKGV
jgi:hypothetical protein